MMRKILKRMKKETGILMAAVLMAATLGGCAQSSQENGQSQEKEEPLKVAMDLKFPPFTGTDENGDPAGLEVDIAYALGEYLDREIVNTDFSKLITSLEMGEPMWSFPI